MLDIKFIRENAAKIKEAARNKNIKVDIDELIAIDEKRRGMQGEIDNLRSERNELAKNIGKTKPTAEQIEKGRELKEKVAQLEQELEKIEKDYLELMVKVPTIPAPEVPIGKDDSENKDIFHWGEPRQFDFTPKSYIELAEDLDLIDFKRGTKVAGYRGYYLKNEAVFLQMAFLMYAMEKLLKKGFTPIIPPTLIKEYALFGSGYFAGRNYNADVDEIYKIANEEIEADGQKNKEDKFLVGTAEPSLLAYFSDEVIDEEKLPLKMFGFSQCYRSEIGSYGKDTKGIYRVHEFMKVEQVCITRADLDEAEKYHQEMLTNSKELHEELGLPYRILQICTGDMSAGKYKMFDIEAWIPSRNAYGETGSASNFVDWQARRLNVKYKNKDGERQFVYMLNDTALASARTLIALLETYQQADGSIVIPEILHKYLPAGMTKISPKK